jgi:hypothetical protein
MLGYFPEAYPDELLYSICARFCERMQYPTSQAVHWELFGCKHLKAVVELPSNLGHLVSVLPLGHNYTVDKLVNSHTLLPFFGPFLSSEQLETLRGEMHYRTKGALLTRVGNPSRHMMLGRLRFCAACVEDDRKRVGECYWHRVHQVACVRLCPIHSISLRQSEIRSGNASQEFVSAEYAVKMSSDGLNNPSAYYNFLIQISRDVDWLLQQNNLSYGSVSLRRQYQGILFDQGLIFRFPGLTSQSSRTNISELRRRFSAYYPRELLEMLNCELDENRVDNWLSRLLHNNESNRYPLYHLLFINLFGYTTRSFFGLPIRKGVFEDGPWPCLNPTCEYYRQFCIRERKFTHVRGKLLSLFSCECGFTYRKDGNNSIEGSDPFRFRSVAAYGHIWEAALSSLWNNPKVTLMEIGQRLGMTSNAVKQHAARLELPFPRKGSVSDRMKRSKLVHSQAMMNQLQTKLESYRDSWLSLRAENPSDSLSVLAMRAPKMYHWLRAHDKKWLDAHKPPSVKKLPSRFIDWTSRDAQLAQKVKEAAKQLRASSSQPRRVTRNAIVMHIGCGWISQSILDRLPLTTRMLESLTESHEDFAIRRLWWIIDCYRHSNIYPTRQQLIRAAGLRKIIRSPRVEVAVDDVLQTLIPSSSLKVVKEDA